MSENTRSPERQGLRGRHNAYKLIDACSHCKRSAYVRKYPFTRKTVLEGEADGFLVKGEMKLESYYIHPRKIYEMYSSDKDMIYLYETLRYYARYVPCVINGTKVESGQLLITMKDLSEMCSVSVAQLRRMLGVFSDNGGITTENLGKKGILITLQPAFIDGGRGKERKKENTYQKNRTLGNCQKEKNAPSEKASEPSYDLARAEERARMTVPRVKKREKR